MKNKKQQGFTLIELMIVVAIIGVLSAVAIPAYKNHVKKSEAATGLATARALVTNVDMYIQEIGAFPSDLAKVGATSGMNKLGTLSLAASGAGGTIKFLFGSNSSIDTAYVELGKSSTGWACAFTDSGKIDSTEIPKSCKP
ncbi:pilin [Vibrio penaeicida]|uniref:Pilus assembly protein PilA n=1 Tax=Vibrio penaeicida TaxID=104609 RepID=A0AAV5NUY9_9VIBR|nr:prepilin-type N-terminal cleavage/methylation domain-containing protein [Vibrio penaeicida]RTZ23671.1 prepilin-type N-terminal cleavage/methylation domain-containing protein [Vibrio penaeicida]GLQ73832.1 pilus assembly protein PilA [Vibrio penaeicida]